ncbi:MAG: glycerate kinase [Planctomycetes bacterium]|nr:glycerate kinase [Planctomycetota bacterium]
MSSRTANRDAVLGIFNHVIAEIEPVNLVRKNVQLVGENSLRIKHQIIRLPLGKQIYLFGIGKAGVAMVSQARKIIGDKVAGGICIVPDGLRAEIPDIDVYEASYPLPDKRGQEATEKLIELVSKRGPADLLLFFISGGGSSMLVAPPEGVSLQDLGELYEILLNSQLPIEEINTIRRHVSTITGGGVLRLARDARVITVILSNVLNNVPWDIASGPTVPDKTNFCDALAIVIRRGLKNKLPLSVLKHLQHGAFGNRMDTFKKILTHERYRDPILLACNTTMRKIAVEFVKSYGMKVHEIETHLSGDPSAAGRAVANIVKDVYEENKKELPICVIASGKCEITDCVDKNMTGRNQELAMAASLSALREIPYVCMLAANTGGEDSGFKSKYSGAIVSSKTADELENLEIDAIQALLEHKVTPALEKVDAVYKNGKFYSNLLDLVIAIASDK